MKVFISCNKKCAVCEFGFISEMGGDKQQVDCFKYADKKELVHRILDNRWSNYREELIACLKSTYRITNLEFEKLMQEKDGADNP